MVGRIEDDKKIRQGAEKASFLCLLGGYMTKTVKVVDAICGSGKSTQVIDRIKRSEGTRWIYVSPYLSEVGDGNTEEGRIRKQIPEKDFQCPKGSKGKHLKELLTNGENVSITHALLKTLDKEALRVIEENEYHIIIDETLDVISVYNGIHNDDIKCLVGSWIIKDEHTGRLRWNYELHGDDYMGTFKEIKDLCDLESLYLHKDTVLINKLSPEVIKSAKSVTILTYLFEGSFMCSWLDLAEVPWEYEQLECFRDPEEIKQGVRENLVIHSTPKSIFKHNYDSRGLALRTAFSSTWYKHNKDKIPEVKKGCQSFLSGLRNNKIKTKVFWTTFKNYREELSGRGYTRGTIITEDGERQDPFVPKNKRASNEYAECNVCMYLVNVYAHGDIASYLETQGMKLDSDKLAVSEMVQFIFRGSVRDDSEMHLMVASERMKKLLEEWLETPK